ncbi:MAG: hypothetical protein FJ109_07005 [Deltaproteobacteria bacterium]|nr:hypothetical protein [Deltaproteobacteria bacterium]
MRTQATPAVFRDRTGFPLVEIAGLGVQISLLPVMKVQFEQFLGEPQRVKGDAGDGLPADTYGNEWYERLLALNPRASWRDFRYEDRERLILTGIRPEEALGFARWLGPSFDLPRIEEWRAACVGLQAAGAFRLRTAGLPVGTEAAAILERLHARHGLDTWADLSLMRGGVLEWVKVGSSRKGLRCRTGPHDFQGVGKPRDEFHSTTYNPLDESVELITVNGLRLFGFRVVKRD